MFNNPVGDRGGGDWEWHRGRVDDSSPRGPGFNPQLERHSL